jgi:hypothetical protein
MHHHPSDEAGWGWEEVNNGRKEVEERREA